VANANYFTADAILTAFKRRSWHQRWSFAHALHDLFGERMARRNLADHLRDPGAIQRSE
jgi:hypothetical protein